MRDQQHNKLIKKAIKGNKRAFEEIMTHHYKQIYRTAFLYVHNQEDALDVVQEATYEALRSIHTLKQPQYFLTWLTRIIIRCAGHVLTKRKQVVPLTEDVLLTLQSPDEHHEDTLTLLEELMKLKENYRTAIIFFYYHDHSIKTISELMNIPEGTVKTYLSRGKEALKKQLTEERSHG